MNHWLLMPLPWHKLHTNERKEVVQLKTLKITTNTKGNNITYYIMGLCSQAPLS
jgi:hypothetical protein